MSDQNYGQNRFSQSGNYVTTNTTYAYPQTTVLSNDLGRVSNVQYVSSSPQVHYGETITRTGPSLIGDVNFSQGNNYDQTGSKRYVQQGHSQGGQVILNQNQGQSSNQVYVTENNTNRLSNLNGPQTVTYTTTSTVGRPSQTVYQQGQVISSQPGQGQIISSQQGGSSYQIGTNYQQGTTTTIVQGNPAQSVIYQPGTQSSQQIITEKKSYRTGQERVINETKMPSRVIETRQLESKVIETHQLQAYEVSRQVLNVDNARVTQNQLPVKEQRPSITNQKSNKDMTFNSEKAIINQRVVEKFIDVKIERPVPRYIDKEVPYDVIVEKPREIITERDVITEIRVEKPYEKIVEVPIQKIVEVPVKKTIERINYVDSYKDIPVQRIVEKKIEHVVETPIVNEKVIEIDEKDIAKYKYDKVLPTDVRVYEQDVVKEVRRTVQNRIEKQVEVPREVIVNNPVQRIIERPVERIVERPVYIENKIEKIVNVPVEQVVYHKVEQIIEEPEYIENIIEKPVYRERFQDVPREVIQERIIEKPVYSERIIHKSVDRFVEKPVRVEREVTVDLPEYVEKPVYVDKITRREVPKIVEQQVIYETLVPVEKVTVVEETIPVPIEKIIDRPVERNVEQYVDNIIEKEVIEYNIIEDVQYVDKLVNVQVEKRVENPIIRHNIINRPVYIDKIVEKKVPRNVEKIVEVKVDKIVEVPVDVVVEVPVFKERQVYKDVYVNKNIRKSHTSFVQQPQDKILISKVESQRSQISEVKTQIARFRAEYQNWQRKQTNVTLHSDIDYTSQNQVLKQKIQELEAAIRDAHSGKIRKSLLN